MGHFRVFAAFWEQGWAANGAGMDHSLEVTINELTPVIEADRQTPRAITQS